MKKRKMPPHIVLPNGMWRFVKSGTKKVKAKVKVKRTRRVVHMARFKKKASRKGKGNGMNLLMTIANGAVSGIGSATISDKVTGGKEYVPFQHEIVAAAGAAVLGKGGLKGRLIAGVSGAVATLAIKHAPTMGAATTKGVVLN